MAGLRRTWDKEFYQKKANDRIEQGYKLQVFYNKSIFNLYLIFICL